MAETIYTLCMLTAFACACMLLKSYHSSRYPLLFWSGLAFLGLTASNLLLLLDKTIFLTSADLLNWRLISALVAMLFLLYGLIWEKE